MVYWWFGVFRPVLVGICCDPGGVVLLFGRLGFLSECGVAFFIICVLLCVGLL